MFPKLLNFSESFFNGKSRHEMHSLECPYFELFIKLMKLLGIPIK